ncbi:DUF305 domain-containing protein [Flavobacterium ardleyense]|uniref:DUF305 domain-containing protein n=1 Tax=Flavobacterium ardleyense TaxID=2038737 RepID=A0ABW5Z4V2_9FLAO
MENQDTSNKMNPYLKFGLMMLLSFVIMYAVMFLNVAVFEHIKLSLTRTYMTLLMVSPMAISMLLFMWKMYPNQKTNYSIIIAASLVFVTSLLMLRNQTLITDVQYMKAMIPHHSSAIMTSSNVDFKDAELKKLAEDIIIAQEKEIKQMNEMILRLQNK